MGRDLLSGGQWERVSALLPGKPGEPGRSGAGNRLFLEAVLWLARSGSPWRDLPERFGLWNTAWQRFRRWARHGVPGRVFAALSGDPDFEYALVDGTIVRVHQHGTGQKRMARPVRKWFLGPALVSLRKRIRPHGRKPGAKMEIRAAWSS